MSLLDDDGSQKQQEGDYCWLEEGLAGETSASQTQSVNSGGGKVIFQCGECMEVFTCKNKFFEHAVANSGLAPYKCERCGRKFRFIRLLREHKLYFCDPCNANQKTYKHEACGQKPCRKSACIESVIDKSIKNDSFTELTRMHKHQMILKIKQHEKSVPDMSHSAEPVKPDPFPDETHLANPVKVDSVNVMVEIKEEQKELDYDKQDEGQMSGSSLSHSQPVALETGTDIFHCETCEEVFTSKTEFHGHVLAHSGVNLYECEACDETFITKSDFHNHVLIHIDQNDNSCKECGITFISRRVLLNHLPVHSGGRILNCDKCWKVFSRKSNLTRHLQQHKKDHPCRICGKNFLTCYLLARHRRQDHRVRKRRMVLPDEGDFACDKCGEHFRTKAAITRHVLTH